MNVFVLSTEYHFLVAMSIIHQYYRSPRFNNLLVLTGSRLNTIDYDLLPSNIKTITVLSDTPAPITTIFSERIFKHRPQNLFVFTCYRDIETWLLCSCPAATKKHLLPDGALFYTSIKKLVVISRLRETLKIYLNLFRRGTALKKLVFFRKNFADTNLVDDVWTAHPDLFIKPKGLQIPIVTFQVASSPEFIDQLLKYYRHEPNFSLHDRFIYISSVTRKSYHVSQEIKLLRQLVSRANKSDILIKMHPNSPTNQLAAFRTAFGDRIIYNTIPAELYIAKATDCTIVGSATAAIFFQNKTCKFFSVLPIFKKKKITPTWLDLAFPSYVRLLNSPDEIS